MMRSMHSSIIKDKYIKTSKKPTTYTDPELEARS